MTERPNFLLIFTDQQRMDSLGCYGNKFVETPNIDRLASEGARLDRAFTPWPVCCPARATMWTGVYPHTHNITKNIYQIDNALESVSTTSVTVFDYLREKGYTTAYFGKWHLGDKDPGKFDVWEGFNSFGGHWVDGIKDGQYKPDVQTDHAIRFLQNTASDDSPFIMVQSYYPPHDPYTAPERFYKPYRGKGIIHPGYYAAISNIDYNVGRLMEVLNETGLNQNTLVMFFSDHGETFGARNDSIHKFVCFEESIRIPFLIYWKDHIQPGTIIDSMIGLEDLMPTIMDYSGCDLPLNLAGRSIRPLLNGLIPQDWREFYYVQTITRINHYQQRCIRTDKWKLILSDGGPFGNRFGPHSLYDLENDPEEETDVFDNKREDTHQTNELKHVPSYKSEIIALATILREYAAQIDDSVGIQLADIVLCQFKK